METATSDVDLKCKASGFQTREQKRVTLRGNLEHLPGGGKGERA